MALPERGSAARIEESIRLSRFFQKILEEALHLQADALHFSVEKEELQGSLLHGAQELKKLSLKASWFDPLVTWLYERSTFFLAGDELPPQTIDLTAREIRFPAMVRVGSKCVALSVKRNLTLSNRHMLHLTGFTVHPLAGVLAQLGVSEDVRPIVERLLGSERGVLAVGAPDPGNITHAVACALALSHAHYAGGVQGSEELLKQFGSTVSLVASVPSDDAVSALLSVRSSSKDLAATPLIGAIVQGFVRRVCSTCAKETIVSQDAIDALPERLRPSVQNRYKVGRGCERCGQTGYSGTIVVQSVAALEPDVRQLLLQGADQAALIQRLYPRGTRALLEDGLQKISKSETTFESVYRFVRVIPEGYLRYAATPSAPAPDADADAIVADFEQEFIVPQKRPSSAAFVSHQNERTSDTTKDARDRPLLLVVEDDGDQRQILQMVFRSANYEVVMACDGVEALEKLKQERPTLIITDLMMPKMDGAEFITKLRSMPQYATLPVLVLTVLNDSDKEYSLLDLGADDYCEKTIQRRLLLKRVEKLVKRARAQ